jgi:hypothetical protein
VLGHRHEHGEPEPGSFAGDRQLGDVPFDVLIGKHEHMFVLGANRSQGPAV